MSRVDEAFNRAAGTPAGDLSPKAVSRVSEEYRWEHNAESPAPRFVKQAQTTPAPTSPHPASPVRGALVRFAHAVDGKIVTDPETSGMSIEQYRRLAGTLHVMQSQSTIRTLMISSALPGDGKTLTSANLALTFSESYHRRVLLIDADLRRPALHRIFGATNTRGLSDALRSRPAGGLPLIEISSTLTIVPAGVPESNPMAALTSERMRQVMEEVGEHFDWVILDTPPIGVLPDAHLLAQLVDAVLLVIRAGTTPLAAIERAVQELGRDRIVGTVLNYADSGAHSGAYYDHYYGSSHPAEPQGRMP